MLDFSAKCKMNTCLSIHICVLHQYTAKIKTFVTLKMVETESSGIFSGRTKSQLIIVMAILAVLLNLDNFIEFFASPIDRDFSVLVDDLYTKSRPVFIKTLPHKNLLNSPFMDKLKHVAIEEIKSLRLETGLQMIKI